MTAPDDTPAQAGECDVAAIGARAAAAFAAERDAVDSLDEARTETNARDFGAQEREHRALRQNISAARVAADEAMRSLLAWIAAEPARVAAVVAGERARAVALRDAATDLAETLSRREDACRASAKDSLSGEIRSRLMGKTSAYGHAAELLTRVLIDADALAAPAQGGG